MGGAQKGGKQLSQTMGRGAAAAGSSESASRVQQREASGQQRTCVVKEKEQAVSQMSA
jgi:hypothetical protein